MGYPAPRLVVAAPVQGIHVPENLPVPQLGDSAIDHRVVSAIRRPHDQVRLLVGSQRLLRHFDLIDDGVFVLADQS
ncbi:hypothetical protein D3C86_2132970 [compost metagenome]